MNEHPIPRATLGRLPMYLEYLRNLAKNEQKTVSAAAVARGLGLGDVLVRKDLAAVSGAGRPKIGYVTEDLIGDLEDCLGCRPYTDAVLVGAGKLGRALYEFSGYEEYGVRIAAAFDCNDTVLRHANSAGEIRPMHEFDRFCREHNVKIGIITVGAGSAQEVADAMVAAGIRAIWNFAPCELVLPADVVLKQENLALSLAFLSSRLS